MDFIPSRSLLNKKRKDRKIKSLTLIALSMLLISPLSFAPPPRRAHFVGKPKHSKDKKDELTFSQKNQKVKDLKVQLIRLQEKLSKAGNKEKKSINKEIEKVKKDLFELEPAGEMVY